MLDLLAELSFGDNLRPSQVTARLRTELADREKRTRRQLLAAPLALLLIVNVVLFAQVTADVRPFMLWNRILILQLIVLAMYFATVVWIYWRRLRFIQEAELTTAVVLEKETISLWALGAGNINSWVPGSPKNIREAVMMEDEGSRDDVPHIVKLRLRFIPGSTNENLDWAALKDGIPHTEVTKRLRGGGWGTFMGDLKQGSLVTLLYSVDNPKHCRIVQAFASHRKSKR